MSVIATENLADQLWTPFETKETAGPAGNDPVGTVFASIGGVGAAGGGTVTLSLVGSQVPFGFRPLIVPLFVGAQATGTGTAKTAVFRYDQGGNRRINASMLAGGQMFDDGGQLTAVSQLTAILIEPLATDNIISVVFDVNTDTIIYTLNIFMVLYDAEIMAKRGTIAQIVQGLR